jgi:hypothetical protein
VLAKVGRLSSTFHHNTLGPMQPSYHKFKEARDLVTRPKSRTTNTATFSFNSQGGGDDLVGRPILSLYMNMEYSMEWELAREIEVQWEPAPGSNCPPQISYGMTWNRTQAAAMGIWWQTTWAMAFILFGINTEKQINDVSWRKSSYGKHTWYTHIGYCARFRQVSK